MRLATSLIATVVLAALFEGGLFIFADGAGYAAPFHRCGIASWYGTESGSRTATGEYFDGSGMTAAMPARAMLGKHVRVTDIRTGRSVVVLIDDIGPARRLHRVIDLSRAAARRLGMGGLARVCVSGFPRR